MSQIDKVVYFPLLVWFCVLFLIFYFFMFSYFLTYFFYAFKVRLYFFNELINFCYNVYFFFELFIIYCNDILSKKLYSILYLSIKNIYNFNLISTVSKKYFILK